jgi:hypothetical protein
MGVSYRSILMVGKEMEDDSEGIDMLKSAGVEFSPEDMEIIEEDGLEEVLYGGSVHNLEFKTLNYYSGCGRLLGFSVAVTPVDTFADRVKELQAKWKMIFATDADIVHAVQVS